MSPHTLQVILYVRDLDDARGFYCDLLGLPLRDDSDWFSAFAIDEHAWICCNARREDYERYGTGGKGTLVELWVDDVDAEHARLSSMGIPFEGPPEDKPWGLRSCTTRDPEGYRVSLSSRIAQVPPR